MRKVVIEVQGGVADVTSCPVDVEVEIIDHDNEECGEEGTEEDFICSWCKRAVEAVIEVDGKPCCKDCREAGAFSGSD